MTHFRPKKLLLFLFVCFVFQSASAQDGNLDRYYYHDSIKIIGVIYSNDLCLLTNLQYRGNSHEPHERSVAISARDLKSFDNLNDSLIIELVRKKQAYLHINYCPLLLEEIFDLCDVNDSVYIPDPKGDDEEGYNYVDDPTVEDPQLYDDRLEKGINTETCEEMNERMRETFRRMIREAKKETSNS